MLMRKKKTKSHLTQAITAMFSLTVYQGRMVYTNDKPPCDAIYQQHMNKDTNKIIQFNEQSIHIQMFSFAKLSQSISQVWSQTCCTGLICPVVLSSCSRKQFPGEAQPWEAESRIQKYNRIWFQLCRLNIVSQQLFLILLWLMILKPVFHWNFSIKPFFVNKSPFITFTCQFRQHWI